MNANPIHSFMSRARDIINEDTIHALLISDKDKWHQLCSSMDAIGDTEAAIAAFESSDDRNTVGERYLVIYGLLQALFVQQDAVHHFCDSIGFIWRPRDTPRIHEIRELRNDCVGHPTNRTRSSNHRSFHHIVQISLTAFGFSLLSFESGNITTRTVQLGDLIRDQRRLILDILTQAVSSLQQRDREFRKQFMNNLLATLFPSNIGYCFEKVIGSTQGWSEFDLGKIYMPTLPECISNLIQAIDSRGLSIDTFPGIATTIEELRYPLGRLMEYFGHTQSDTPIDSETAYIFAIFARDRFEQLQEMAKQIDEDMGRDLSDSAAALQ